MDDWLRQAQALKLGQRKKILHCGSTPSLSISATLQGWRGYCHRCTTSLWEPRKNLLSLKELAEFKLPDTSKAIMLPRDFRKDYQESELVSLSWMTWVLKGGITQSLRDEYSLGWSKKYAKGVIPLYKGTELQGIIYRRLIPGDPSPKYTLQHKNANTSMFLSNPAKNILLKDVTGGDAKINCLYDCVIVEDVLSAIRVGQFLLTGSLLGTSLGEGKIMEVITASGVASPRIGVWLDPDRAGAMGAAKLTGIATLMGLNVTMITSRLDPKNLTDSEIVRRLTGDRCHLIADYEAPQ